MVTASYIAEILKTLHLNEQSNGQLNSFVKTLTGLLIIKRHCPTSSHSSPDHEKQRN